MIGARSGHPTAIRRLIARATARHLRAFVVPGPEIARAAGLDLTAAGLDLVPTPRRANVLVLIAPLPQSLVDAAAVSYAQMPRPRSILVIGELETDNLPKPDATVNPHQVSLAEGVGELRRIIAEGTWLAEPEAFDHEALKAAEGQGDEAMAHHHHHHGGHGNGEEDQHGSEPDHEARHSSPHPGHGDEHDHGEPQTHQNGQHEEHAGHGSHDGHESHQREEHSGHEGHESRGDHGGHGMDHSSHGGGFMSMIAMTRDLPRSPDELQMDWLEVPFGPLHPGLPAGLNLTLTLDGDRIAGAKLGAGITRQHLGAIIPATIEDLPARLAPLDPLAPGVYRLLAELAGETVTGVPGGGSQRIVELERARLTSHLGWLASFGEALGYQWLADEAGRLQLDAIQNADVDALRPHALRMRHRLTGSFLLRRRLEGVGRIDPSGVPRARGPVARAMGIETDARIGDSAWEALGFAPVVHQGGDALARLMVRLDEIVQSIDLIQRAIDAGQAGAPLPPHGGDSGSASIETPRGEASLHLTTDDNLVTGLHLETPSTDHVQLVPAVAEGQELSAGLVGIASLDISPWEVEG